MKPSIFGALWCLLVVGSVQSSVNDWDTLLTPFEQDEHPDLHAVVINQNGKTLLERYFNGGDERTLVDVRSAGKSVTALLMGIALDQQRIIDMNDPVAMYWSDAKNTAVGAVPLHDLLTMRSGLDADANDEVSFGYEDFIDASADPKAFALTVPKFEDPGTRFRYNSLAAYIAGIVIGEAAKQEMGDFAQQHLFGPLNIQHLDWQKDRSGLTKGQGNLFINAIGFTRLGELVLNGGAYQGQQIVSQAWIKRMLHPLVDTSKENINAVAYGYYWYQQFHVVHDQSVEVWYASGNGGNKIYLVPSLDMVVTVMSDAYGQGRSHRRSERILMAVLQHAMSAPKP